MKKIVIVLLVLLVAAAALLFGLRKPQEAQTPVDFLTAAAENMDKVSGMRFQMALDMDLSVLAQQMDLRLTMDGAMTAEPAVAHGVLRMDQGNGAPTEMELYMEKQGGETVTYTGTTVDGAQSWSSSRSSAAAVDPQSWAVELLAAAEFPADAAPEQLSETELRYSGTVSAAGILPALQAAGMPAQPEDSILPDAQALEQLSETELRLTVTVDRERSVITGYTLDMTAAMRQILTASLENAAAGLGMDPQQEGLLEVTSVTMEMKLYDFDLVESIGIPAYVKNAEKGETANEEGA